MRLSFLILPMLIGCSPSNGTEPQDPKRTIYPVGTLEDERLVEASGIAMSRRQDDMLWILNDGGARAILHATSLDGAAIGQLRLDDAKNRDWEDLAAVTIDDINYLVVADIGDNERQHDVSRLIVAAEPDLDRDARFRVDSDWKIRFVYPDGPRDAESLAVDPETAAAYILTKRDLPPRLYRVSLDPDQDEPVIAQYLGDVQSLPIPKRRDVELAQITKDWYWQPTAMDFASDGRHAVVLTYDAVYLYARPDDSSWFDTLNSDPLRLSIDRIREAEALAFSTDGRTLFLTVEKKKDAPLYRIDLTEALEELATRP